MPTQLSDALLTENQLAERVSQCDPILNELLPPSASAYWDLRTDELNRPVLTLGLSDPFGYAEADFAPDELSDRNQIRERVSDLVGELIQSARRERIEIRDAFVSADQIANFQQRLNAIPQIAQKHPKLYNRIQMSPSHSDRMLITDFAVEVDSDVANQVKEIIRQSGFNLRGDPLLERQGVVDSVRQLVASHLRDEQPTPKYAVCFNTHDPVDLHLLEISEEAVNVPGSALEGVGFAAGDAIPGARSIILYLATPDELRQVALRHPNHRAVRDLKSRLCRFIYPNDDGLSFYEEFPELAGD